ncbi:DUF6049 family protein [Nocardioides rubriscoriae]|uniref:DUF6049 family protein n=1 Tax=Nocardioides rubriscoriae TaxID=642762 RepID=UPI0011E03916|nr:DUF6049 family protein [Nocardioides rubriscoriae]
MVGPRRYVRALAATCALGAGLALTPVASPATAATAATSTRTVTPTAADPLVDDAPLGVTIRSMTPGSLPATGNIVVTGTVTNRTDETWSGIKLYAIGPRVEGGVDLYPALRNQGELEQAMQQPFDEIVGERLTNVGTPGSVEELPPGASSGYTVVVPADAVQVTRAGVYWFGVHAIGESAGSPYDLVADGRARTFLPYVPRRFDTTPVTGSLVVPLAQPVRYAADGSVDDEDAWVRALDDGGRLTRLLDLVAASPTPVTWVVDPALVDAVAHLAEGNRPRSLDDTTVPTDPSTDPGSDPSTDPSTDPAGGPPADDPSDGSTTTPTDEPSATAEPLSESAQVAAAWLARLGAALQGDEVLTLPYGNVDVPATVAHDPDLLRVALAQRSVALASLGVDTKPVISSPSGYLDAASIRAIDPDTQVLVTDRMLGADPPAAVDAEGHRLLVTSYGATQGSPGPGRTLTTVGIRQRLLAEAAVRVIKNKRPPLVAVLPLDWELDDGPAFFAGLQVPWLDLGPLADVDTEASATTVSPDDLDYPRLQRRRELDAPTVDAVADLIKAGDTLQNVLVDNTEIGGVLTEEALTGLSYFVRYGQTGGRLATGRSRAWVGSRLSGVRISASPGVTLSSSDGKFVVNLTNTLDHRVAVSVRAESDDGIEVLAPERIVLPPGGRDTVLLRATTTTNAVHNVTLSVTDPTGAPLGSTAQLPIRPTQVSGVIWLIMGTGAGLLFLAIAVRLFRRVAAGRRGEAGAGRRPAGSSVEAA